MKLEIFFDYLCEFCEIGHQYWSELLPLFPRIEPVWRPCEAHPRTEEPHYGRHSDLAIQGMLFVQEYGGDVVRYNDGLFEAVYRRHENIEDVKLLARYAEHSGVEATAFLTVLKTRVLEQSQRNANRYAYGTRMVQAVPTYILEDGRRLDSILGVGVSKAQLKQFLESANH